MKLHSPEGRTDAWSRGVAQIAAAQQRKIDLLANLVVVGVCVGVVVGYVIAKLSG